ncbi:hypothetical protein L21SP4_01769 [Kiritimatiella glycovorans]|uniref:Uncharacterized protein n=1 Tax=Kiritimatiella glycovorans TaxID=1307763 RepID=A0A0G3EHV4_9BACT|nr:hypothetical protein L21SP4_01769 [Kiritimatiella glycovorans]
MIRHPDMHGVREPRKKRMSPAEYISFCDFCIRNNPRITPQNCMERKTGEETITTPFKRFGSS